MDTYNAETLATRDRMTKHATEVIKKVPNARWYALEEKEKAGLASILEIWQERRAADKINYNPGHAVEFVTELAQHVPSLLQNRPTDEAKLAELLRDPVTGQVPANPFAEESLDLGQQALLQKKFPELARYLQETKNGLTYAYLIARQDGASARALIRELTYGEREHRSNPFRTTDLPAQAKFVREHPQAVTEFWKREATTPVSLPWQWPVNQTELGLLERAAPDLRRLATEAAELEKAWADAELAELRELEAETAQKRKAAEQVLKPR